MTKKTKLTRTTRRKTREKRLMRENLPAQMNSLVSRMTRRLKLPHQVQVVRMPLLLFMKTTTTSDLTNHPVTMNLSSLTRMIQAPHPVIAPTLLTVMTNQLEARSRLSIARRNPPQDMNLTKLTPDSSETPEMLWRSSRTSRPKP
jgi:hypothetical protein